MLDRVKAVDLIPRVINKCIRPYVKQHNLDEDTILYQYIADLVQRQNKAAYRVFGSSWESRAVSVINCISSVEYKCMATLQAIQKASVPLKSEMENLVAETVKLNHSLVTSLKAQLKLVELKNILYKYDLGNHNITEGHSAQMLVRYILKSGKQSALKDALEVTQAYPNLQELDAYIFYLCGLAREGRHEDCIKALQSLPLNKAVTCAKRIALSCSVTLNDSAEFDDNEHEGKATITRATVEVLRFMKKLSVPQSIQEELVLLEQLEKVNALQVNIKFNTSLIILILSEINKCSKNEKPSILGCNAVSITYRL